MLFKPKYIRTSDYSKRVLKENKDTEFKKKNERFLRQVFYENWYKMY